MEQKLAVSNDIIFFALKYALSKNSDAPVLVMDTIKENIIHIKDSDLRTYVREIHEHKKVGMPEDKEKWLDFADYLQDELRSRE